MYSDTSKKRHFGLKASNYAECGNVHLITVLLNGD